MASPAQYWKSSQSPECIAWVFEANQRLEGSCLLSTHKPLSRDNCLFHSGQFVTPEMKCRLLSHLKYCTIRVVFEARQSGVVTEIEAVPILPGEVEQGRRECPRRFDWHTCPPSRVAKESLSRGLW